MINRKKSVGTKAGKSTKADVKKSSQTIAKPNVGRSFLKSLEIDVNETGFCIWVKERVKIAGKFRTIKHWVIDGSMLKKTGVISMGTKDLYKIEARYDAESNTITVGR